MVAPMPSSCRRCSAELPAGSAFCNRCGASQLGERAVDPLPAGPAGAPPLEQTLWTGSYSLKAAVHLWLSWPLWVVLVLVLASLRDALPAIVVAHLRQILWPLALLPGLVLLGRALLRKWSLRYRLTNHRLFLERGLLSRRHDELELIRVDDVSARQSLLQRLVDVGSVTVLSSDATNPELVMEGIAQPLAFKETLRAQVRDRRARTTFLETL